MTMRPRMILFAVIAVALAALFVRLGVWQLDRLSQRKARNARVAARVAMAPVPFAQLPRDTGEVTYRRATIAGVPDYSHELVLASRTRNGSPGVYIFTPLRVAGSDTAVMVNRGWVYAPDGSTADLSKWREGSSLSVDGYVEPFLSGLPALAAGGHVMRRATLQTVRSAVPYPVAPLYLVVEHPADSAGSATPARVTLPDLSDEGPHFGYAMQWFAFAIISIVGAGIGLARGRREAAAQDGDASR